MTFHPTPWRINPEPIGTQCPATNPENPDARCYRPAEHPGDHMTASQADGASWWWPQKPNPLAVCANCRQAYRDHAQFPGDPAATFRSCLSFRQLTMEDLTNAERAKLADSEPAVHGVEVSAPGQDVTGIHHHIGSRCTLEDCPAVHDPEPFRPHERETLEAAARNALDLADRLRNDLERARENITVLAQQRDQARDELELMHRQRRDADQAAARFRDERDELEGQVRGLIADIAKVRIQRDEARATAEAAAQRIVALEDGPEIVAEDSAVAGNTWQSVARRNGIRVRQLEAENLELARLAETKDAELAEVRRQRDTAEALAERRGEALDRLEADASQDKRELAYDHNEGRTR